MNAFAIVALFLVAEPTLLHRAPSMARLPPLETTALTVEAASHKVALKRCADLGAAQTRTHFPLV